MASLLLVGLAPFVAQPAAAPTTTWARTYGGPVDQYNVDNLYSIQQTTDGGYVALGATSSWGAYYDVWILRLNGSGSVLWEKVLLAGGTAEEYPRTVRETSDGGFIVAAITYALGSVPGNCCKDNAWLIKLDANGNVQWQKAYGTTKRDGVTDLQPTADGGLVMVGHTNSHLSGSDPPTDLWVVKLDVNGNVQWQKAYGDKAKRDWGSAIQQLPDGGYVVMGQVDLGPGGGYRDIWLLRLTSTGTVQWQKRFGGAADDGNNVNPGGYVSSGGIALAADGGFVVGTITTSFGAGGADGWVFKVDGNGNLVWQNTYGAATFDYLRSIVPTSDGGFIAAGTFGAPTTTWLLRLDANGAVVWQKSYGEGALFGGSAVQQTSDGGFVLAARTPSSNPGGSDGYIVKTDANGSVFGCVPSGIGDDISGMSTAPTPVILVTTTASTKTTSIGTTNTGAPMANTSATVTVVCGG